MQMATKQQQGCHGEGLVREKHNFFKVRKQSGNSVSSKGNAKLYLKLSETLGNFFLGQPPGLGRGFLIGKGDVLHV